MQQTLGRGGHLLRLRRTFFSSAQGVSTGGAGDDLTNQGFLLIVRAQHREGTLAL